MGKVTKVEALYRKIKILGRVGPDHNSTLKWLFNIAQEKGLDYTFTGVGGDYLLKYENWVTFPNCNLVRFTPGVDDTVDADIIINNGDSFDGRVTSNRFKMEIKGLPKDVLVKFERYINMVFEEYLNILWEKKQNIEESEWKKEKAEELLKNI